MNSAPEIFDLCRRCAPVSVHRVNHKPDVLLTWLIRVMTVAVA